MQHATNTNRPVRLASAALASLLLLAACGSDERNAASSPTTVNSGSSDDPRLSPVPTLPPDQRYEAIPTIIDDGGGPRLCFTVLESLPPRCGVGIDLAGWSWDAIDVEQVDGGTTWVDQIYVSGTYDAATSSFTVDEARLPTDADRDRILLSAPLPDTSVPCEAPAGGWPERTQEWPAEEVAALDGFAGWWSNDAGVVTVKFTGDLAAAETAVRGFYTDALCVVAAGHSEADLRAIQGRLEAMSSIQFLSTAVSVDASGEWVDAEIIAPDPARQAAFDEELGEGVVRLRSALHPVA